MTRAPLIDLVRNPLFVGRCFLCGAPIAETALYCYAHSWAAPGARMLVQR